MKVTTVAAEGDAPADDTEVDEEADSGSDVDLERAARQPFTASTRPNLPRSPSTCSERVPPVDLALRYLRCWFLPACAYIHFGDVFLTPTRFGAFALPQDSGSASAKVRRQRFLTDVSDQSPRMHSEAGSPRPRFRTAVS